MHSHWPPFLKPVLALIPIVVLTLASAPGAWSQPLGTAFTYQGELRDAGAPASGTYDFEFQLFRGATGVEQVGPTNVFTTTNGNPVAVSGGVFTVRLDFGDAFAGEQRFLQIRVKRPADAAFTVLAPRQEVSPAPHALNAEFVTDGRIDSASLLDAAVTAPKIAAGAVGNAALANNAVTTTRIADGAVVAAKIGGGAVGSAAIADGAVGAADINAAQVQQRVVGSCTGAAIRAVNADGSVVCDTSPTFVFANALVANPSSSVLTFLGPAVTVNKTAPTQRVHVTAHSALGAGAAAATGLDLFICYRPSGGTLTNVGAGVFGLTAPANQRHIYGLSAVLPSGLAAGAYDVGLCGIALSSNWTNNDFGYVTAIVL